MTQQLLETITQIKLLEVENDSLTQTIGEFERQAAQIPQIIRQYNKLEQELKIASRTLEQLLTRRDTLSVELAQSQFPWEIISEPQLKRDAFGNPAPIPLDSQKKLVNGLMGGLFAGIAVAVLLEKFRNTFYTAEDIEDTIRPPLLETITWHNAPQVLSGTIPATKILPGTIQKYYDDVAVFESFKSLYASLRVRHNKSDIRSVVISSAVKEENDDRFAVAWNLAETAAATGQKVLLVDANLSEQQSPIKTHFMTDKGLSDLLFQGTDYQQFIQPSPHISNFSILTAGQIPSSFSHLLGFGQMPKLMAEFERDFDLVIYNTAPILESMDTSLLAVHTQGILMTVAINKTKKSLVTKAIKQIEHFNLPLLGIVSTQVNTVK
jgi:capsular exopolysaccharide synthesis family protein